MTKPPADIFESNLCKVWDPGWLRNKAKETGLIKRERKIDPVVMFWVLVLSFGVRLQRTLAQLKREYEKKAKVTISDSSWYERFTPELVDFLRECVLHGMVMRARGAHRVLCERLDRFKDVLIQDSTIIRLHDKLASKWPAARTRKTAAGVKVGLLVSAVANGPTNVGLYGERTSEIKTLKIGEWVKDRILLVDLGFYKYRLFVKIKEYGGFFVTRLRKDANPTIVAVNKTYRGNSIDVVGKKIKEVLPLLKRKILDVDIELSFKRGKYNGKQRMDTERFRLVAILNNETDKYHVYLTNIDNDTLNSEDIIALYRARWDVELIFKELKSKYAMDMVNTTNPQIVEAYIWIAILTLTVSRIIHNIVRSGGSPDKAMRYTRLRWATTFAENASDHLTAVLQYLGIQRTFMTLYEVYESQALDPHVERERFTSDLWD